MDGAVLVIHDEQALRAAARQALTQSGRQVVEAAELREPRSPSRSACGQPSLFFPGSAAASSATRWRGCAKEMRRAAAGSSFGPSKGDMPSAVAALEFGADDCLAFRSSSPS